MTTVGSLCSGYGGLDLAAEQVTGGTTVWHCEYEAAPSAVLAHRFPDIPNYGDLKSLVWADDPVDVLAVGYPCQPFSGAGLRLGTEDPRHLFPWIALGIERMRPPLVLLENVRGHLTLGFDVVLAALDRLGYDVRWTLHSASDVGSCHRRSRLWIAARAREAGGWPAPTGEPTALIGGDPDGPRKRGSGRGRPAPLSPRAWISPQGGLFGHVPAVRPGTAGVMVDGLRWDTDGSAAQAGKLLPTPTARLGDASSRGASHPDRRKELCSKRGGELDEVAVHLLGHLLPTPVASDANATPTQARMLSETVALLPAPRATDGTKGGPNQRGSSGDLMLPSAVQLLPTPAATDARGARNSTSGRREGSEHHAGDTLGDLVFDGRLLPTPEASDATGGRVSAEKGGVRESGAKRAVTLGTAVDPRHLTAWGPYTAAIARWEALTRPAPSPTKPGRNGPRLSPAFVEWMQGLPEGWVTAVPGITRNQALRMLGNGVVSQCGAAAYALLGVSPALWEVAA